jgi:aryl-alcohol dehydrogenase-like predicted oxidoreductase
VIATKFGFELERTIGPGKVDSRRETIIRSVDESMKRLRTDRIDLLYQHRVDPNAPVEEVAGTVKELINEGKVRGPQNENLDAAQLGWHRHEHASGPSYT